MRLSLIAALDRNGVIGDEQGLPWRLPRDLRRFRELTWGQAVVMGRTTHEHIGRALPGRQNIVLSRQPGLVVPDCLVAASLDDALARVETNVTEVFVIGGRQVYCDALPKLGRMYLTIIDGTFRGTTWFPCELILPSAWSLTQRELCEADENNPYRHAFLIVDRCDPGQPPETGFDLPRILASPFELPRGAGL
jgi:dihydrofolate reductase